MTARSTHARRRAIVVGSIIVAAYVVFASWSGHLTPLARGPLLDGLAPTNYRWVNPPPELASTNEQPSSGEFPLEMGPKGIEGAVVFTTDNQVTVIVATDSIEPKAGQEGVDLTVTPLDPATLPAPGDGLSVFGNAYAIDATYRPSGSPVRPADMPEPLDVILVYPSTTAVHATSHQLAYSSDDTAWRVIDSSDSAGSQQVEGNVPGLGTVTVVGEASASPSPSDAGGSSTLTTSLLVAAGCLLLLGVALLIRSRRM